MTDRAKLEEALCKVRKDLDESNPDWFLMPLYKALVAAAEAHLATLPRTKLVEVWRVEYCISGEPDIVGFSTKGAAHDFVARCGAIFTNFNITGPHQQCVPA